MAEPAGGWESCICLSLAGETTWKVILARLQIPELLEDNVPFWELDPFAIQLQGEVKHRKRTSGSEASAKTVH